MDRDTYWKAMETYAQRLRGEISETELQDDENYRTYRGNMARPDAEHRPHFTARTADATEAAGGL